MKLHIGCGDKYWPGFVNVDQYAQEADVNADCKKLPFEADYADEIHTIHFIEHVPRLDVNNMLLDWHRVLKPGGKLFIEVPCLDKIAQSVINGEKNMRLTVLGIFGDPRDPKPGMMHQWCYTSDELKDVLLQCGYSKVIVTEPKFHLPQRDMRVEAIKE